MSSARQRGDGAGGVDLPFASVGIVGLGVMGGSLARTLDALTGGPRVVGWSLDPDDLDAAEAAGVLTRKAESLEDCVSDVALVVLATPVDATCALLGPAADAAPPDSVIHDVASLKAPVHAAAVQAGLEGRWVGGHPMAGSEASGFGGSHGGLYRGARVWLTSAGAPPTAVAGVEAFWRALGARPQTTDAAAHDRRMALASHLPQLTANVLARVLAASGVDPSELGPGGQDATRLAASAPQMWMEILAHAPDALPGALRALAREVDAVADAVEDGELSVLRALMEETRSWRGEA